jgi:tetratricopeptide (TPR) repeat protein
MLMLLGATIIFQGFQCSSREMTTAKVAIKNGDNAKAIENLQLEIEKNSKNAEAYILLAELKSKQGHYEEAVALMDKAEPLCAGNPQLKDKPAQFKFNVFKDAIDNGQKGFNSWIDKKKPRDLERAISNFNSAIKVRPHYAEAYRMMASAYELSEQLDSAEVYYNKYAEIVQSSIDIAIKNGFYIGATENLLTTKLGTRNFIRGSKLPNADSIILNHFKINGKDLYVQTIAKKNGEQYDSPIVQSWFYNPPENILQGEREIVPAGFNEPLLRLATIYYNKEDYENSLKYFKIVSTIEPNNTNANSAIITLYQELGKTDEAIRSINENIQRFPDNSLFVAQLGDIYMNREDFDKAIEQYEKAIKIKPDFDGALRNIASCYGNKAAKLQQKQIQLISEKKQKELDIKLYEPTLLKAIEYFIKTLETPKFKNDPDVLGDLCVAYLALPTKKTDFEKTLKHLETLEDSVPKEKKEAYYIKLYKIYSTTSNPKMTEIENKINAL